MKKLEEQIKESENFEILEKEAIIVPKTGIQKVDHNILEKIEQQDYLIDLLKSN